jgi:hypothetical protein
MEKEIRLLLLGEEERGSLARLSGDGVRVPAGWRLSGNGMASRGSTQLDLVFIAVLRI